MELSKEQKQELQDSIIEDLIDSNFTPDDHEAYAYIIDSYPHLGEGRVGSIFLEMLNNDIDWEEVERDVKRIKEEAGVI